MSDNFLPNGKIELLWWSGNFSTKINLAPLELGLTPEMSAEYANLHSAYAAALSEANDPQMRTRGTVSAMNDRRKLLRAGARRLNRIVQAHPGVSNEQRIDLGLSVRRGGGGSPALQPPQEAPHLEIRYTSGRRIGINVRHNGTSWRGKPTGVQGASIFMYVGDKPPADLGDWSFVRSTTRTRLELEIGSSVPAGSKIYLAAFWYAPRGQHGPLSEPVSTYIGEGMSRAA